MIGSWILCLVILGLAVVALDRYQKAPGVSGRDRRGSQPP